MSAWTTRDRLCAALICLPAVMAVIAGTWYVKNEATSLVVSERLRVTRELRVKAEELKDVSRTNRTFGAAIEFPVRRKGWRTIGRIGDGPWGVGVTNGESVVWFARKKNVRQARYVAAPPVREADFTRPGVLIVGIVFIDLVLAGLAYLAAAYFLRYVRERDEFVEAAIHDLRTPLFGMSLWIGRDNAEAKKLNERMMRLVDNLREFYKLGGHPKPKVEVFDLVAAYREAYSLFAADYRDSFEGREYEDVVVEGGEAPLRVRGDETMTVQILWNLLGNDLKYAAPYGRVFVRFSREGKFVKCDFVDEGQGMTRTQMRKAFNRYYRAKTVLECGKGGFGIGLCTAKEFVRAMGGNLTVAANRPKGCVFTLTLPAG